MKLRLLASRIIGNNRGMTLVELSLAMGVLLMCALLVASAFPVATQSRTSSDHRSIAVSLAQRQLEAARDAGYNSLLTYNGCLARNLIDPSPSSSPYDISDVTIGTATNQSIAGTLPSGSGEMIIATESGYVDLMRVTVTVTWVEQGVSKSVTLSTLISYI